MIQRRSFTIRWWAPRSLAWWAWALPTVVGGAIFIHELLPAIQRYPLAAFTSFLLSVAVGVGWWFFLKRPQIFGRISRSGAYAAMMWGAFAATGLYALSGNGAIILTLAKQGSLEFSGEWGAGIAAPFTEEIGKLLGIAAVLMLAGVRFRTPFEGVMIGAYVGLGFQVAEGFLYGLNIANMSFGENEVVSSLAIYTLRYVVFVGISHSLFSACAGAALAYWWPAHGKPRFWWGALFMTLAFATHAAWNSPLEGWIRLVLPIAFPWGFFFLLKAVRRHEQAWFRRAIATDVAQGLVPPIYATNVQRSIRLRRKNVREVGLRYGALGEHAQKRLDGLLVDLADAATSDPASHAYEQQRFRALMDASWANTQPAQPPVVQQNTW